MVEAFTFSSESLSIRDQAKERATADVEGADAGGLDLDACKEFVG